MPKRGVKDVTPEKERIGTHLKLVTLDMGEKEKNWDGVIRAKKKSFLGEKKGAGEREQHNRRRK